MKREEEILANKLLGESISRFSLGDTWWMSIGEYYLEAHEIEFEDENRITKLLEENYTEYHSCVDREDISKATIMAANLRKPITQVRIDNQKNLTVYFDKGTTMKVLTNTDIVDWQWCVNRTGKDPYSDYEVACFWAGELKIKENIG